MSTGSTSNNKTETSITAKEMREALVQVATQLAQFTSKANEDQISDIRPADFFPRISSLPTQEEIIECFDGYWRKKYIDSQACKLSDQGLRAVGDLKDELDNGTWLRSRKNPATFTALDQPWLGLAGWLNEQLDSNFKVSTKWLDLKTKVDTLLTQGDADWGEDRLQGNWNTNIRQVAETLKKVLKDNLEGYLTISSQKPQTADLPLA